MEAETRNLQNDFFNSARKSRANVTIFLANGKKLTGRIKSFDKFTVMLENHHGEQIIFKHAISTVSASNRSSDSSTPERRETEPAERGQD